jgi:hypothetical protein
MRARPGALDATVLTVTPSTAFRMRSVMVTEVPLSRAIVPSMISRACSGTAIFGPTTTTCTLPALSARAISLATG